jgi:hypothetical protein
MIECQLSNRKWSIHYNSVPRSLCDMLYLEVLLRNPSPAVGFTLAGLAIPRVNADFLGVEVDEEARRPVRQSKSQ